ncbi:MAG: hypothetical protein FRX49_09073 [Trebouxia sp. A1-2]|nr:MAG: hypothetical protein FRX49_09073 [Trebouxia sp. A1-2]
MLGEARAGRGRAGQSRTGQSWAGQGRARQGRAGQGRAATVGKESSAQGRAKQMKLLRLTATASALQDVDPRDAKITPGSPAGPTNDSRWGGKGRGLLAVMAPNMTMCGVCMGSARCGRHIHGEQCGAAVPPMLLTAEQHWVYSNEQTYRHPQLPAQLPMTQQEHSPG